MLGAMATYTSQLVREHPEGVPNVSGKFELAVYNNNKPYILVIVSVTSQ